MISIFHHAAELFHVPFSASSIQILGLVVFRYSSTSERPCAWSLGNPQDSFGFPPVICLRAVRDGKGGGGRVKQLRNTRGERSEFVFALNGFYISEIFCSREAPEKLIEHLAS